MHCSIHNLALSHPFQFAHRCLESGLDAHISGVGALTITDGDSQAVFEIDVPGFSTDDIKIELENSQLVVSGEIKQTNSGGTPVYSERCSRSFRRVIRLDSKLDPSTADAELNDGVLKLSFARKPDAERRRIEVRSTTSAA